MFWRRVSAATNRKSWKSFRSFRFFPSSEKASRNFRIEVEICVVLQPAEPFQILCTFQNFVFTNILASISPAQRRKTSQNESCSGMAENNGNFRLLPSKKEEAIFSERNLGFWKRLLPWEQIFLLLMVLRVYSDILFSPPKILGSDFLWKSRFQSFARIPTFKGMKVPFRWRISNTIKLLHGSVTQRIPPVMSTELETL